jgi:peptidyl-prolyl cis-trans isomerase C
MKLPVSVCIVFTAIGLAQTPTPPPTAPALAPDTVIAEYGDGKKLTYGELEAFLNGLSPQMRANAMRDRKRLVEQYVLMKKLNEMAEKDKLDEKSPYKEVLNSYRLTVLMNAEVQKVASDFPVRVEEQQAYYDQHKTQYEQVTIKLIHISFSSSPSTAADGKKRLSEEEAKAKAEQLVKEAKAGADFVKLVKENSDDETTKAKNGDLAFSRAESANLPEAIRSVALALKPGDVSEPVRQPNGFYIFRGESVSAKPFAEVRDQIFSELQRVKMTAWMESTTKGLNVKPESDQFFSPPATQSAAPTLGAPHAN